MGNLINKLNENGKKTVIIRGPLLTQSGYGCHSRQVARWLFDRADVKGDVEVVTNPMMWGRTPWLLDPEKEDGLVGKIIQNARPIQKADISIQIQLPNEWDPFLADYNIGMSAVVETDKCNPQWIDCVNNMDLVIVPSEFCKNTLENSGKVTTPVVVVPESYFDKAAQPHVIELENVDTPFNFLVFGQFTGNNPENDRKNLLYTIKWMAEAFEGCDDVGVLVKTNFGRHTTIDRQNTLKMLSDVVMQVSKPNKGPKFYLLHGEMSEEELSGLYHHPKVKALVSLTRGEGFGLPLLEAAVAGLPVIATNHSAHIEFLGKGKFISVDCSLVPIHQTRVDGNIFLEGVRWAMPDEKDAKRKMVKFYRSSQIPIQWAQDLKEKLLPEYAFDSIKSQYNKVFDEHYLNRVQT